jgi:hypothetical protein
MNTIIEDVFRKKVALREDGKIKKISQVEALFRRIVNDGLKGNARATDQAIKLIQMMSSMKEQTANNDSGELPDHAADIEALETLFRLYDVSTGDVNSADVEDE